MRSVKDITTEATYLDGKPETVVVEGDTYLLAEFPNKAHKEIAWRARNYRDYRDTFLFEKYENENPELRWQNLLYKYKYENVRYFIRQRNEADVEIRLLSVYTLKLKETCKEAYAERKNPLKKGEAIGLGKAYAYLCERKHFLEDWIERCNEDDEKWEYKGRNEDD